MQTADKRSRPHTERVIFSLPRPLVAEVRAYAEALQDGNKSGFVAEAIRAYIVQIRKTRHTARLRESYLAASGDARAIAAQWDRLGEEAWARIDALEAERGA